MPMALDGLIEAFHFTQQASIEALKGRPRTTAVGHKAPSHASFQAGHVPEKACHS